ncbi:J domain-containing protein [Arcobacter porcinus]|uniref:Chaperone protein DnaJ n=1 Tax=Arcobacter porcinus TaxID=1935204 RepID=A0A1C0B0Q2_9BACT|nr:J domain-containing protein [Arcobacter porcinus]OCL91389.1 Chaperone protein DnaJ [Aliarcobacter thereius]OCL82485.1 Chaperone protein DnaJ [Arcobacter porcinus]OCL82525.1 Chaperone protein DnaJ [Arcobacter porcinus]OCL93290.1 Chaperone protein DnaJ [Arcobacter porcinus]QEP40295.1 DnaJ domain-containing protein [Arcobacter porcinus]
MGQIINLAILILILYLIFTNFGIFLMIIGGVVLFILIAGYFLKKELKRRARNFEYQFKNFSQNQDFEFEFKEFKGFNQNFNFNDFNNFNNSNYQNSFYANGSKLNEAKDFFGFSDSFSKDEIKKRYKELAKKYHPDLNGGDEEKMKKLNDFRDILMKSIGE